MALEKTESGTKFYDALKILVGSYYIQGAWKWVKLVFNCIILLLFVFFIFKNITDWKIYTLSSKS